MSKRIVICADDYAQHAGVSDGIVSLLKQQRINAVSCLTGSPLWPERAVALHAFRDSAYLGLHMNLTHGDALSTEWQTQHGRHFPGLPQLLGQVYLRRLNREALMAECRAQLSAFVDAMGFYPDFIDGHQHIHQLPLIRDCLLTLYRQQDGKGFFRNSSNGWRDWFSVREAPKRQLISLLGGGRFRRILRQQGIPCNTGFAGIYNFSDVGRYRQRMQRFLQGMSDGGLIMCHPGLESGDPLDPLGVSRCHEWRYFMSDAFLADMAANACVLQNKSQPASG